MRCYHSYASQASVTDRGLRVTRCIWLSPASVDARSTRERPPTAVRVNLTYRQISLVTRGRATNFASAPRAIRDPAVGSRSVSESPMGVGKSCRP